MAEGDPEDTGVEIENGIVVVAEGGGEGRGMKGGGGGFRTGDEIAWSG